MTYWKNGDIALVMPRWERKINSPPVYGLTTYKITEGKIGRKDGVYTAQIAATLEFPPGNPFHSKKKWIFELNKTRYGWEITDHRLFEN